jgi:hypothetical protein
MALEHRRRPVYGVQFHPESILTECGYELLANFLRLAGMDITVDPHELWTSELRHSPLEESPLPVCPVTF